MGEHEVSNEVDAGERRQYMQRLLTDVQALEEMLARGMLESGRSRIGAEQELVLIDSAYRPALCNLEIIRRLDDPIFTTELARFNLEFNLPPLSLCGDCLRRMESQIKTSIDKIRKVAGEMGVDVLLVGILPTPEPSDLVLSSLTPMPRYAALNEMLMDLRGGPYQFVIKGADELRVRQDSVMLEACNTSFQVHFQVSPEDFAHLYNTAQAISAPVLAAASNSPILFGKH
ncbi:MAG: glutamate-cysteine ligase family protein, partial [Phycisphaerae bacterium]